jgi:predicted transcriptional regulator
MKERKTLTKSEIQVMNILWGLPEGGSVYDILEGYDEPKPAYTTVATFLRILQNKGFVKAEKMQGRQQRFIPLVTKDEYTSRVLGEVKDDFFDGSGMSFVKFFMKKERMTADQLKELIELVEKGE